MVLSSKKDVMLEILWRAGVIQDKVVRASRSHQIQRTQSQHSQQKLIPLVIFCPSVWLLSACVCVCVYCMTEVGVVIHSSGAT